MRRRFQSRRCSLGVLASSNVTAVRLLVCELREPHDRGEYLCCAFPLFLHERVQDFPHLYADAVLLPIRTWSASRSKGRR